MKTSKEFEKHIHSIIKKYTPILLLQRHTFRVENGAEESGGPNTLMACVYNYPYLNITIKYSEKALKKWQAGQNLEEYVVHEMCHAITDPFYCKATERYVGKNEIEDERERLTDHISIIAFKMLNPKKP